MKVFIKVYADDLKSASVTFPINVTARDIKSLKVEIEEQIDPKIKSKDQILSLRRNGVIVTHFYFCCDLGSIDEIHQWR